MKHPSPTPKSQILLPLSAIGLALLHSLVAQARPHEEIRPACEQINASGDVSKSEQAADDLIKRWNQALDNLRPIHLDMASKAPVLVAGTTAQTQFLSRLTGEIKDSCRLELAASNGIKGLQAKIDEGSKSEPASSEMCFGVATEMETLYDRASQAKNLLGDHLDKKIQELNKDYRAGAKSNFTSFGDYLKLVHQDLASKGVTPNDPPWKREDERVRNLNTEFKWIWGNYNPSALPDSAELPIEKVPDAAQPYFGKVFKRLKKQLEVLRASQAQLDTAKAKMAEYKDKCASLTAAAEETCTEGSTKEGSHCYDGAWIADGGDGGFCKGSESEAETVRCTTANYICGPASRCIPDPELAGDLHDGDDGLHDDTTVGAGDGQDTNVDKTCKADPDCGTGFFCTADTHICVANNDPDLTNPPPYDSTTPPDQSWAARNKNLLIVGGVGAAAVGGLLLYKKHQDKKEQDDWNARVGTMYRGVSSSDSSAAAEENDPYAGGPPPNNGTTPGSTLSVSGIPAGAKANNNLTTITVSILSPDGIQTQDNDTSVTVSCESPIPCTLTGTTTVSTVKGKAEFSDLRFTDAHSNVKLRIAAPGFASVVSPNSFNVSE